MEKIERQYTQEGKSEKLPEKETNPYLEVIIKDFNNEFKNWNFSKNELINFYNLRKKVFLSEYKEILKFSRELERIYGKEKCIETFLWHILVGSTPPKEKIKNFDFEGENSIINFLKKFKEKYKEVEA